MIYLLHGPDEFSRAEAAHALRAKLVSPDFGDLNLTFLDGAQVSFSELRHHADSIPFLGDKRVVTVEGLLTRLDGRRKGASETGESETEEVEATPDAEFKKNLADYMVRVPETTHLIFVEPKTVAKTNVVLKALLALKKGAQIQVFEMPTEGALLTWIPARAALKGGTIEPAAAQELALYIGPDLRRLDNELDKLCAYCAGSQIRRVDVQALVVPGDLVGNFELSEALGRRQTDHALKIVHNELNNGVYPLQMLGQIEWQVRVILQMQDLQARGISLSEGAARVGLKEFPAKKALEMARGFTLDQLLEMYHKLLETDIAIKTSQGNAEVAMDVLMVELTRPR